MRIRNAHTISTALLAAIFCLLVDLTRSRLLPVLGILPPFKAFILPLVIA